MPEKVLHLNLMKNWFDQILKGTKKIEYREIKSYWTKRLFSQNGEAIKFDYILFRNGYSKDCRKMKVKFNGIFVSKSYEIVLGEVFYTENC